MRVHGEDTSLASTLDAERVFFFLDEASGLKAWVILDDTTLGPAAGGIRTRAYPSTDAALRDAADLARAMTIKCAISGLDAGGGKGVVMLRDGLHRGQWW